MKKKIKLTRDYGTSPLWKSGGKESWGENHIGEIELDFLPISEELKNKLNRWQKRFDNYYAVMEKIPGGGWSHHSKEDFEKARNELGVIDLPDTEIDKKEEEEILLELKNELHDTEYEIVSEK